MRQAGAAQDPAAHRHRRAHRGDDADHPRRSPAARHLVRAVRPARPRPRRGGDGGRGRGLRPVRAAAVAQPDAPYRTRPRSGPGRPHRRVLGDARGDGSGGRLGERPPGTGGPHRGGAPQARGGRGDGGGGRPDTRLRPAAGAARAEPPVPVLRRSGCGPVGLRDRVALPRRAGVARGPRGAGPYRRGAGAPALRPRPARRARPQPSAVALRAEVAERFVDRDPGRVRKELAEIQRMAREAVRDVREVVRGHRTTSLRTELDGMSAVLRAAGIECEPPVTKLGVANRHAAVRAARDLGWM
ncbi:histidine kinase dimerization/phosphoacceptor domain-containing protein [Actinomadura viridis]|uniref:histidine kinase dimerization/phosphoacceptor domain-containing protein n=1 Tax=Actinomadura viridis TaxID=58110 RepID=UPI0036B594D7